MATRAQFQVRATIGPSVASRSRWRGAAPGSSASCGARAYIAVAGGIQTPLVLGAPPLVAMGGLNGSRAATGDRVPIETTSGAAPSEIRGPDVVRRVVRRCASCQGRRLIGSSPMPWRSCQRDCISPQSNRMGFASGSAAVRAREDELI
jgi:allophanate hydrolase subunit 2